MKNPHAKVRPGFTIVELLIVIVIIGILAAISIIAYNGIQNKAADSVVKSDLRQATQKTKAALVTEELPTPEELYWHADASVASDIMSGIFKPSPSGYSATERYPVVAIYDEDRQVYDNGVWRSLGSGYTFYALSRSGGVYISNSWDSSTILSRGNDSIGLRQCLEVKLSEMSPAILSEEGPCYFSEGPYGIVPIEWLEFLASSSHGEIVSFLVSQMGLNSGEADAMASTWLSDEASEIEQELSRMRAILATLNTSVWPFQISVGEWGVSINMSAHYVHDYIDIYDGAIVWDVQGGMWLPYVTVGVPA